MADVKKLWNFISDAWLLMDRADRRSIEQLWAGYQEIIAQLSINLNREAIDPLVEYAVDKKILLWENFDCTGGGLIFSAGSNVASIPLLQDRIENPNTTLTEGVDYTIVEGNFIFASAPNAILWAPEVYQYNDRVHEVLGDPVDVHLDRVGWNAEDALPALQCLWYTYIHGPTQRNIRASINALMGLPYAKHAGQVVSITSDTIKVRYGDSGTVYPSGTGRAIAGTEIDSSFTGLVDHSLRLVIGSDVSSILADDYYLTTGVNEGEYIVREKHNVASSTVISELTSGATDANGRWFTGVGGDWAQVDAGDLINITAPSSIAGYYQVEAVDSSGARAWLRDRVQGGLSGITFTVEREPWIRLDSKLPDTSSPVGRIVRPNKSWPFDVWQGSLLVDSAGSEHIIWNNGSNSIRISSDVSPGVFRIRPRFAEDSSEAFDRIAQAASAHSVDDYVYRFDPLLDGVRLSDWRTDERWQRWQPGILALNANANGTTSVQVSSVSGVFKNGVYDMMAEGEETIRVSVSSVSPPNTVVLDKAIPSTYTTLKMARLVPAQLSVEGLKGFYVIADPSTADTDGAGLSVEDLSATFNDGSVLPGDHVRMITSDGTTYSSAISTVVDDEHLTVSSALPAGQSGAYYQIVRPYTTSEYATLIVDATAYVQENFDESLISSMLSRFLPNHIKHFITSSSVEILEIISSIIEDERILEFIAVRPISDTSRSDEDDNVDDDFLAGPSVYEWVAEYFTDYQVIVPTEIITDEYSLDGSLADEDDNVDVDFTAWPYNAQVWATDESEIILLTEETYYFPVQPPAAGSVADGSLAVDGEFFADGSFTEWEDF
jgi:hypothetical protein